LANLLDFKFNSAKNKLWQNISSYRIDIEIENAKWRFFKQNLREDDKKL